MIRRISAYFAALASIVIAHGAIREAPISEFPRLPPEIRRNLQIRGCTVPQSPISRKLIDVVHGHFRDSQHTDWAVLCDARNTGTEMILVYWGGKMSYPVVLTTSKLDHGECGVEISPVGKPFIMEHYRAYGGHKPPPIDHQGINVGICEKASTVSYFYRNHWLTLTGAD